MSSYRFISPTIHSVLDYALDASLVTVPLLAGFQKAALWVSVAVGAANLTYSALTSYRGGLLPLLPFRTHLLIDLGLGALMITAATVLGFTGWALAWYLAVGIGISLVVVFTDPGVAPSKPT